jgi:beta-mannanase
MDAKRGLLGTALAGAVVVAGLGPAGVATAATTTTVVYAGDDAYTSSARTTANFGTADKLVAGRTGGETRVSYVKFATGTRGASVAKAILKLPVDGRAAAARMSVYPAATGWSEKTVTAATAPAVTSTNAVTITPKATDTVLSFDVSKWVTRPGTYAFAIRSSSATAVTRFRSVEFGDDTTGGPELDLTWGGCTTGALLVPTCGVLWGAAAGGFTDAPRDEALREWEGLTGRTAAIFHTYHKGDELFPTADEIAMTTDPAHPRVLLENWKVAYGTTWAKVAAGAQDARIDRWAAYVKANYTQKFFLALHHEPENDVNPTKGSGMTAADYAAMYRHTILRLRQDGVTNVINVLAYMGNEKWMAQSWWPALYPGDDVVDWVGLDSYVSVEPGYYHYGDFSDLLDRQPTGGGLGWYDWVAKNHPAKPVMVAEWGMYHRLAHATDKSAAFATVVPELKLHPKVKAIVYFDTASDNEGDRNISVDSTPASLAAFRKVAADPMFDVTLTR